MEFHLELILPVHENTPTPNKLTEKIPRSLNTCAEALSLRATAAAKQRQHGRSGVDVPGDLILI